MGVQSRLVEKPGEETFETEEGEGNWDWELDSKTRNGSWEERCRLDVILVVGTWGNLSNGDTCCSVRLWGTGELHAFGK